MTTAFVAYLLGFGSGAACDRYRNEMRAYAAFQFTRAKNAVLSRLK
jgi:hypothetical protein